MIVAIIDLGTNTSNLVVARLNGNNIEIRFQGKEYVRLGDYKITENLISPEAIKRATASVERQVATAKDWNADKIRIIATSAVRHASNQKEFIEAIRQKTGLETEIIDGDREATLIYYGVKLAMGSLPITSVILDIGGGSNEIIICENGAMHWKRSYPSGMSRIINSFSISDPITRSEATALTDYFNSVHREAFEQCRNYDVKTLIGCSGAFNTLADIIDQVNPEEKFRSAKEITISDFENVYRKIFASTHRDRAEMKGMDPVRTDLIVPALILSSAFIENAGISKIIQTSYALREGVLFEMLNS